MAGVVIDAMGETLSILMPEMGPAVAQCPSRSHTVRVFVDAFAVCVFAGTFVVNANEASDAFNMPTPASVAVQLMFTSVRCHAVSADPQFNVGPLVSIFTVAVALTLSVPATSCAEPVNTVLPFALIGTDVLAVPSGEWSSAGDEESLIVVEPIVVAPVAL